jgi:hypothetical protein
MSDKIDEDFIETFINGKPIADIPKERLERIQRWLIIVYRKIEYGLAQGINNANLPPLSRSNMQAITSEIYNTVFRVPIFELIQEEEIATQLLTQQIRPMTVDDIFHKLNEENLTEN